MPSQTSRDNLKRNKYDHTERNRTDYYKTDALHSHERPHDVDIELRKPDRVLDRAATEELEELDNNT